MLKIARFLLIPFLLIFLAGTALAQVSTGRISGIVRSDNKQPLAGATVTLRRIKDSGLVKIAFTDETGKYEFEWLKWDAYRLEVSNIEYKPFISQPLTLDETHADIKVPTIDLARKNPTELTGVSVISNRPFVERKIDRTIVNVGSQISNAGSNALEILEKAPGVLVDPNGSISLKGKPGVVILIDERPTNLSGADLANYLRSLPAGMLDKIEIMTNPPARYPAAGNAGVINIKLKRNRVQGFRAGISHNYTQGVYARTNNSVNLTYNKGKLVLFSNLSQSLGNGFQELDINRTYKNPDGSVNSFFNQKAFFQNKSYSYVAKLGMDYYITPKTTIGIGLDGFLDKSPIRAFNESLLLSSSKILDSAVYAVNTGEGQRKSMAANMNFKHVYDSTGHEISMDLNYSRFNITQDLLNRNTTFGPAGALKSVEEIIGDLPTDISISTANLDYTRPLNSGMSMEAGLKTSFISTDNIADYLNRVGGVTSVDFDKTNRFKYRENINAGYLSFTRESGFFSFKLGLRLEQTATRGNQLGNAVKPDSSFTRNYTNLFPTAYFGFKLDSNDYNQIILSYGRRIDRPYYQDLNPFLLPADKFTFFAGNPLLLPQLSNNLELSYIYKNALTVGLNYSNTNNLMYETIEQVGNRFFSRTGNIGRSITAGFSMDARIPVTKKLTLHPNFNFSRPRFKGTLYGQQIDTAASQFQASLISLMVFSPNFLIEVTGLYRSARVLGQFEIRPVGHVMLAAQQKMFKRKASLTLVLRDIFLTNRPRGSINAISQSEASFSNLLDTRTVTLSFSYSLGKTSKSARRRDKGNEPEQGRVKDK